MTKTETATRSGTPTEEATRSVTAFSLFAIGKIDTHPSHHWDGFYFDQLSCTIATEHSPGREEGYVHQQKRAVVLIGPAGSGKEVQGRAIERSNPGFLRRVMGEYLRDFKNRPDHPLAGEVLRIINAGNHLDDEMCCKVFREMMDSAPKSSTGFVVDGFPRSEVQSQETLMVLAALGVERPLVIVLEVPLDICERRLLERGKNEGRIEDQELHKIRARLSHYDAHVVRAINYFEETRLPVLRVDGNRPPEFVTREIARWIHSEWTGPCSMSAL